MLDLESIERIKQRKARYFRFLDTADLAGLQSVFCPDAVIDFKSPSYEITFRGWDELADFFAGAFTETRYGLHNGHHPEIGVQGDTATGLWYLQDIFINEEEKLLWQGTAIYEDRYERRDGNWLIAQSGYRRMLEVKSPLPDDWEITSRPTRRG